MTETDEKVSSPPASNHSLWTRSVAWTTQDSGRTMRMIAAGAAIGALFAGVTWYHGSKTKTLRLNDDKGEEIKQVNQVTYRLLCWLQHCDLKSIQSSEKRIALIIDRSNRFYDMKLKLQTGYIKSCSPKHRNYAQDQFQEAYDALRSLHTRMKDDRDIPSEIAFYAGDLCKRILRQLSKDYLNFMDTCDRLISKQHIGIALPY